MRINEDVNFGEVMREESSHGPKWRTMHGGYFFSPAVAAPLVAKIAETVNEYPPDTVVDLGGGTGSVLNSLLEKCGYENFRMIDMDLSSEQLAAMDNSRIIPLQKSSGEFTRSDLGDIESQYLFISRSTLHYAGQDGLEPLLKHIRGAMRGGEFFIHQSACFANQKDADVMNFLYRLIGTEKWYPTVKYLVFTLQKCGFAITDTAPAPTLFLTSESLFERYGVNHSEAGTISAKLAEHPALSDDTVLRKKKEGFTAFLPYTIFVCRAV